MASIVYENIICPKNSKGRCRVKIYDDTNTLVDPYMIEVAMVDSSGNAIKEWSYPGDTRVVNADVGIYYIDIGDVTPNDETAIYKRIVLNWSVEIEAGGELVNATQTVRVLAPPVLSRLKDFRLLIDKARKLVDTSNDCFLGYTDEQLVSYLEGGMATINAYQPGGIGWDLDGYPWNEYGQIAFESGLLVGVMSQTLFAIDTDIPNYSDQGTSFVIQHQPQLAAFFQSVAARLDKLIPAMKLNYVSSGSLHTQLGGTFRFQHMLDSSPHGALFRNIAFRA